MLCGKIDESSIIKNTGYGDSYLKGDSYDHTYRDGGYSDFYRESI